MKEYLVGANCFSDVKHLDLKTRYVQAILSLVCARHCKCSTWISDILEFVAVVWKFVVLDYKFGLQISTSYHMLQRGSYIRKVVSSEGGPTCSIVSATLHDSFNLLPALATTTST